MPQPQMHRLLTRHPLHLSNIGINSNNQPLLIQSILGILIILIIRCTQHRMLWEHSLYLLSFFCS
jgi:hypothetical protein